MRPHKLDPLPDDVELPPETGTTFARQRARQGARRGGRHRPPGDRRRLGHRGGGARRRARASGRPATPAIDATDEQNLAKLLREVPA